MRNLHGSSKTWIFELLLDLSVKVQETNIFKKSLMNSEPKIPVPEIKVVISKWTKQFLHEPVFFLLFSGVQSLL